MPQYVGAANKPQEVLWERGWSKLMVVQTFRTYCTLSSNMFWMRGVSSTVRDIKLNDSHTTYTDREKEEEQLWDTFLCSIIIIVLCDLLWETCHLHIPTRPSEGGRDQSDSNPPSRPVHPDSLGSCDCQGRSGGVTCPRPLNQTLPDELLYCWPSREEVPSLHLRQGKKRGQWSYLHALTPKICCLR